jgi:hypothetical protein
MGGLCCAEDKVLNPQYARWSKFKLGTYTTVRTTESGQDGKPVITDVRETLRLVGPDSVTFMQDSFTVTPAGSQLTRRQDKVTTPKMIALPAGKTADQFADPKPAGTYAEGKATLTIAGREYKATWYKYKTKTPAGETGSKRWVSDEVPTGFLKAECVTAAPGKPATTRTVELMEFKTP